MRDYISHEIQDASRFLDDLKQQEQSVEEARQQRNRQQREAAETRASDLRDRLLAEAPPAALYEYLNTTKGQRNNIDVNLRTTWQEKNRNVDCLQLLTSNWKEGLNFYQMFSAPTIDLSMLPAYSFTLQFTFRLDQPYISRDEQNFYIIDNPVRKDKVFGLPYVASTSWKGSLRSALWHLGYKEKSNEIRLLFGNEKATDDPERLLSGRLCFFPTFFTRKSLEILNPQDRERRSGTDPIAFECVPEGSEATFTLLYVPFDYVPFDLIGEDDKKSRDQVHQDLGLVAQGIQAMFRIYGFGAKTSSGFGLAREVIQEALIEIGVPGIQKVSESANSFEELVEAAKKLSQELRGKSGEEQHDQ
jgi:CRISPR-associated protein Cmr2